MSRTIRTPIQKRFSDVDSFHHVNNVSQQSYFDVGKTAYYRDVLATDGLFDRLRIITVATNTSYLGQVRYAEEVFVTTTVERIGTTSMTLLQRLYAVTPTGEELRTESRSVMVAFDYEQQCAVAVPDAWRRRMLA